MRYNAGLTAGALKVAESRVVADLLLNHGDAAAWKDALFAENLFQARNPMTAKRLRVLLRQRLETMTPELWQIIRDGAAIPATHACLAAAIKHTPLLGDFLDLVVRDHFRRFAPKLSKAAWDDYVNGCRGRDPEMPEWTESTRDRLRSSVFQALAQAGYVENTRSLKLQPVSIAPPVLRYLQKHNEDYVLRCMQVSP